MDKVIMGYTISKISIEQIAVLQDISYTTFVDAFYHLNNKDDIDAYLSHAFELEKLEAELRHPETSFYFLHPHDLNNPYAYIKINTGLAQSENLGPDSLEVERIYVRRQHQSQQLGHTLMDFAIRQAHSLDKNSVWLGVWDQNERAINFYKKLGFEKFDTHDFFIGADRQTDILMKKMII